MELLLFDDTNSCDGVARDGDCSVLVEFEGVGRVEGAAVEMLLFDDTNSCKGVARDGGCSVLVAIEGVGRVEGVAVEMLFIDELSNDENETEDRFIIIDGT